MPTVNPDILRWARESAGLTLEEATVGLGLPPGRLRLLETGDKEPSRPVLVKMAKKYRRSLLTFYLLRPPREAQYGQDFRTLHGGQSERDEALLTALLRDIHTRQNMVRSAIVEEEEDERVAFVGSVNIGDGFHSVSGSIVRTLGFDLEEFRGARSPLLAFNILRRKVEEAGVFVVLMGNLGSHHTNIDAETFRGYAIADEIAPFVVVNENDSQAAWSFTLLHELAHIWLGATGVSGVSHWQETSIERFCNQVAGAILLPDDDLAELVTDNIPAEVMIEQASMFASDRNISTSMVLYKLYLLGRIDIELWRDHGDLWRTAKRVQKKTGKGRADYYVFRRHRLGAALVGLVGRFVASGTLTSVKAGKVLGVNNSSVRTLTETVNMG